MSGQELDCSVLNGVIVAVIVVLGIPCLVLFDIAVKNFVTAVKSMFNKKSNDTIQVD